MAKLKTHPLRCPLSRLAWLVLWLGLLAEFISRAQNSPATLPNLNVSMGGEILTIALQADGKVILGGDFTSVNGVLRTNLARVNSNGSLDATWNPNPDGVVSNLVLSGSELFVAGAFTNIGGQFRTNLAKLGTLDAGLADPLWAPQPNGPVYCLALETTNLYVGGGFTKIGGGICNGAARLSTQGNGALTSWTVNVAGGQILALVATSNAVYVAGAFSSVNGVTRSNLAKLNNAAGAAVDASWNPNPDQLVNSLFLAGDALVVGGQFRSVGGPPGGAPFLAQTNLAKIELGAVGAADNLWRPQLSLPAPGCSGPKVYSLSGDSSYVYVTGQFEAAGGVARRGIARFSYSNGQVDTNWQAEVRMFNRLCLSGECWYPECNSFDGDFVRVRTVLPAQSGLYVGGRFSHVGGEAALGIARLDTVSGATDRSFPAQTGRQREAIASGLGQIFAIATQVDGKFLVGGRFELINGQPRLNLARVNADGTLDDSWQPNPNDRVLAVATRGDDVYVGGDFTWIGGTNISNLARLNATSGDSADPNWLPAPNSRVSSIAVRGTNLCAVGDFTAIGTPPVTRGGVAFISPDDTGPVYSQVPQAQNGFGGYTLYGWFGSVVMDDTYAYLFGALVSLSPTNGLTYNLGRLRISTGEADSTWKPFSFNTDPFANFVEALVVSGTNVYIAGSFGFPSGQTNLARLSAVTGNPIAGWGPRLSGTNFTMAPRLVVPGSALALCGTNLYVAGSFKNLGGTGISYLARLDAFGTGAVNTAWSPQPDREVYLLCTRSNDVFAAGYFNQVGGDSHSRLALFSIADAPAMYKVSATNLLVLRNPDDGPEVTHFRITGITGGALFLDDGITPVVEGDFITAQQGEAGLSFVGVTNGSVTAVSALNATAAGAGSASTTLNFAAPPSPILSFLNATYSVLERSNIVRVTVRKAGPSAATVQYFTSDGTAVAYDPDSDTGDYLTGTGTLSFPAGDTNKSFIVSIFDNATFAGDRTFQITLTNATGGARLVYPARATVTIVDDDAFGSVASFTSNRLPTPVAPPVSTGGLQVTLQPPAAQGQWRLAGELFWRNSGAAATGLPAGNYLVEFKSVTNYYDLVSDTIPVNDGQTTVRTYQYAAKAAVESGQLTVLLYPQSAVTNTDVSLRAQWRVVGDAAWRDSGQTISNLNAGGHLVEFKAIPNYAKPLNREISVFSEINNQIEASYLIQSGAGGLTPRVLNLSEVTDTNLPYIFAGQLQTDAGLSSGVVVKERVVLTAAHALFKDLTLEWVTSARWFFQSHAGDYLPVPQLPRGWYVFSGYAAQRTNDIAQGTSPGYSTSESQQLDAAALYFIETDLGPNLPGRGGYSGYLSSSAGSFNEHLVGGGNKLLAGYPLIPGAETNWGKMHVAGPTNAQFTALNLKVFSTPDLRSFPGNSGGPLCVQWTNGIYYPAAVYLGGTAETRVRAIDNEVVDLINRAENSAHGGGNSTGGGVTLLSPGITAPPFGTGLLTVNLTPTNATLTRPGWRVSGITETNYFSDPVTTVALIGGGGYPLEFRPVPGFVTPSNRTVQIAVGQVASLQADYVPILPRLTFNPGAGLTLSGGTGARYQIQFVTNLAPPVAWVPFSTNTLSGATITISNTQPASVGNRFYRAALLP